MKYWFLLAALALFSSGCQADNHASRNAEEERAKVQDSVIEHNEQMNDQEHAEYLANLAADVPDVKDAAALVVGDIAIVGIQLDGNLERAEVGLIKYSVAEALKYDPKGANAVIIADPDIKARIKELGEDFRNGKPISGILNELADMTGRVMPQLPGDIIDDHHDFKAPEQQGNKLDNQQNRTLEENQEKQSNHHLDQNGTKDGPQKATSP